jgi:hypothetical protein
MFRCELCHTIVPARQRAHKIVLATRQRVYASRGTERRERPGRPPRGRIPQRKEPEYDKGGVGTEIVREAMVCPKCAGEHEQQAAARAAAAPPPAPIPDLPGYDE